MIKYFNHKDIDKQKWDECISKAPDGIIYAYSWYLDIVCPGWEALVENDYEKVFPLTARKKSGINYLFQPFFTQQLGMFSTTENGQNELLNFIQNIPEKYRLVEINLNTFNKPESGNPDFIPNLTHELYLNQPYESIVRSYSANLKRNIRQATNTGLLVQSISDPEEIINIFRNNKGKEIMTLKDEDFLTLKKIIHLCISGNSAFLKAVINKNGRIIAGAVFLKSLRKMIFLFSGTSREAKSTGAMSFLIDNVIREYSQSELTLDFEGSNDVNLARFYKSFGAEERIYYQYRKNELPLILSKSITFIKWIRKQNKPNKISFL